MTENRYITLRAGATDYTGQRFGHLKVNGPTRGDNPDYGALWECQCDCGNVVLLRSCNMTCATYCKKSCPMRRPGHRTECICQGCKKPFMVLTSRLLTNKAKGKFCSYKCRRNYCPRLDELISFCTVDARGCWVWNGQVNPWDRATVQVEGKCWQASRYYYTLRHGPIPDGLFVCHHCDNPRCLRDECHFLGMPADNSADMVRKGRNPRGEAKFNAKITDEKVRDMRIRYAAGEFTTYQAAEIYGVTQMAACNAIRRKTWKHVV